MSLSAAVVAGSLVGFAFSEEPVSPGPRVAVAETQRAALPAGSTDRGLAGVEATAVRLAAALDAVPVREGGDEATRFCPGERLRVRWVAPVEGEFSVGGHVSPVGPAPDDTTDEVNGLVVCESEPYAYMGFEARWDGRAWDVAAVPSLSDEHGLGEHGHDEPGPAHGGEAHGDEAHGDEAHGHDSAGEAHRRDAHSHEPAPRNAGPAPAPARGFSTPSAQGIEGYASYDPQRVCDPAPKPGTTALKNLLLRTYPGTRNLGVSRTCTARGVSEHKEGRAFDWGVNVGVASERAAAERVLAQLLATDAAGNRHALARRLGVMYVIWDQRIWSAYSAARGWRAYGGANPHTDHVHLSLSWDGAMGRTSYWQGGNAALLQFDPELQLVGGPTGTDTGVAAGGAAAARDQEPRASRRRGDEGDQEPPSRTGRRERDPLRHEADEARREYGDAGLQAMPVDEAALAEQRAAHAARKAAERAAREAATAAARQQGQERAAQAREAAAARQAQADRKAEAKRAAATARKAKGSAKGQAKAEGKVDGQADRVRPSSSRAGAPKGANKGGKGRG